MKAMKTWHLIAAATLIFLITHLFALTLLPVFADESIYIRWAQLIMDEPARYAFFALNDGKTPLFIWMLVPFQYLFADPLFAGRFVAVLGGVVQLIASVWLTQLLGGKKTAQWITAGLVTFLPFWFLHHRLALMDGWLTACLTLSVASVFWLEQRLARQTVSQNILEQVHHAVISFISRKKTSTDTHLPTLALILFFGSALWLKLPAVMLTPVLFFPAIAAFVQRKNYAFLLLLQSGIGIVGGLLLFALLRVSPAFGQLFSRGSDFLFPWQEVVFAGSWRDTVINIPTYGYYFVTYFSWLILLPFIATALRKKRKEQIILLLGALTFFLPIALLGKNVYPRYFLPVGLFITSSAALALEQLVDIFPFRSVIRAKKPLSPHQRLAGLILLLSCLACIYTTCRFIVPALTATDTIPFVSADRKQYLTEWSSGHGVKETVELLQQRAEHTNIAVATEGFFGTLPDAVLMYLHQETPEGVWVEGVGQPVGGLTTSFLTHVADADEVWLVVNSHRLLKQFPEMQLIAQYCRPYGAPCLQVWDITEYAQNEDARAEVLGSDNL